MSAIYLNITETQVARLKPPSEGTAIYRDSGLAGFGLKVSHKGLKTFFVEGRVKGQDRTRRKGLGRFPQISCEDAKASAYVYLSEFSSGRDPIAEGRVLKSDEHNPTLARVRDDYFKTKSLKPSTEADYLKVLKWGVDDWSAHPITQINRDMIATRHRKLGERSPAQANYCMRVIRALYNYAIEAYRGPDGQAIVTDNPVLLLSRINAWHRVRRRRTVIKAHQLPAWFEAVEQLQGEEKDAEIAQDYLRFLLYTGARKTEAAQLKQAQVDLKDRSFILLDTKNWEDHALPMSEPVYEILNRRLAEDGEWVFPGKAGPIGDCRKWLQKVVEACGVDFTLHDLRRTFATVAESLDISGYTLKRLLNHKINQADVTAGYIVSDVERMRDSVEAISQKLTSNKP